MVGGHSKTGGRAEAAVKKAKMAQLHHAEEKVLLHGKPLKNSFSFKYLGFLYQANGDWRQAVEARMVLAKARFGKMYNIWDSSVLDLDTKLQLYESAVVSVLVYGCEGWWLTDKLLRSVNGWNSRCLSRVTGRTYREEAVAPTL